MQKRNKKTVARLSIVTLAPELAKLPFWRAVRDEIDHGYHPTMWEINIEASRTKGVEVFDDGTGLTVRYPRADAPNFAAHYIAGQIIDHARDLLPDNEGQLARKVAGEKMIPPAAPPTPDDDDDHLPYFYVDIIEKGLRDNFPPNYPARFKIETLLAPQQANGDYVRLETEEECHQIKSLFDDMAYSDQVKALGGWSPLVLNEGIDRDAVGKAARTWRTYPAVRFESGSYPGEKPYAEFGTTHKDSTSILEVFIRAGSTKAEALVAAKDIYHSIDQWWDELIRNPDDETGGGK